MSDVIAKLLAQLNELDECENIEAKRSADDLGKSALETISAFSNEPGLGGGSLLFGVSEVDAAFVATGVNDPGKLAADLASQYATGFNRAVRPRISQESIDGKAVVAATFSEAAPSEKPIFIATRGMHHGTFRRIGSTDQRATEDDLRTLFGAAVGEAYEDTLLPDEKMGDVDTEVLAAYRRALVEANPGTELRDASDDALVQAVGRAKRGPEGLAFEIRLRCSLRFVERMPPSPTTWPAPSCWSLVLQSERSSSRSLNGSEHRKARWIDRRQRDRWRGPIVLDPRGCTRTRPRPRRLRTRASS